MFNNFDTKPLLKYLNLGILGSGVLLRIVVYFQNRSLFIDEGALASEIVGKSFAGFFEPLSYQFSPPLFSSAVKIATLLLGANEYGLRLIPLLAGISGLLIFYRLLNKIFTPKVFLFTLGIMAFAIPFIHYSTECKQYSTDVLVSVFLLSTFYKYYRVKLNSKQLTIAALIGSVLIWCSMPVVFILFGMGLYFLIEQMREKHFKQVFSLLAMCGVWLASFAIYFFLILKKDADIGSLASYHSGYFFPLIPKSLADVFQAWDLLMSFLKTTLRATILAQLLGLSLFIAGVVGIWRKKRTLFIPILIPIASCTFASGLGLYSLIPRMILFTMPLVLLVLTYGIQLLFDKLPKIGIGFLTIVLLLVFLNLNTFRYFFHPFQKDEIRPVLEYVNEHQSAKESVFVHHLGITAFRFYQYHHDNKLAFSLDRVTENDWSDNMKMIVANQSLPCWVVLAHVNEAEKALVLGEFKKYGNIADEFQSKNSSAILIK